MRDWGLWTAGLNANAEQQRREEISKLPNEELSAVLATLDDFSFEEKLSKLSGELNTQLPPCSLELYREAVVAFDSSRSQETLIDLARIVGDATLYKGLADRIVTQGGEVPVNVKQDAEQIVAEYGSNFERWSQVTDSPFAELFERLVKIEIWARLEQERAVQETWTEVLAKHVTVEMPNCLEFLKRAQQEEVERMVDAIKSKGILPISRIDGATSCAVKYKGETYEILIHQSDTYVTINRNPIKLDFYSGVRHDKDGKRIRDLDGILEPKIQDSEIQEALEQLSPPSPRQVRYEEYIETVLRTWKEQVQGAEYYSSDGGLRGGGTEWVTRKREEAVYGPASPESASHIVIEHPFLGKKRYKNTPDSMDAAMADIREEVCKRTKLLCIVGWRRMLEQRQEEIIELIEDKGERYVNHLRSEQEARRKVAEKRLALQEEWRTSVEAWVTGKSDSLNMLLWDSSNRTLKPERKIDLSSNPLVKEVTVLLYGCDLSPTNARLLIKLPLARKVNGKSVWEIHLYTSDGEAGVSRVNEQVEGLIAQCDKLEVANDKLQKALELEPELRRRRKENLPITRPLKEAAVVLDGKLMV